MPNSPLAETLAPLSELGVETSLGAREGDGWVAAERLAHDPEALGGALAEIRATLNIERDDVCASMLVELWAWLVAAPAAAGLVAGSRLPDVSSGNVLLYAQGGLADWRAGLRSERFHALPADPDARHPDAVPARDEGELLGRLGRMLVHAHLAPVVETLNRLARRPERALWRGAADRVAGAFVWVGDQLGSLDRSRALALRTAAATPPLRAKIRIERVQDTNVHLRHGCCLYYKVPDAPKCIGCPLLKDAERVERVTALHA